MPARVSKPIVSKTTQSSGDTQTPRSSNSTKSLSDLLKTTKPDATKYKVVLAQGKRCDPFKLTEKSLLYRPAKIVVLNVTGTNLSVRNQELHTKGIVGSDWTLGSDLIGSQCWSPDQYTEIKKINRTEMARIINEEVGDCICKIEFNKQPDPKKMAELIRDGSRLIEESDESEEKKTAQYKKIFDRLDGEYREIRGYIQRSENLEAQESETGMLKFIDAEIVAEGNDFATRLINLRSVKALTLKLTRYELK